MNAETLSERHELELRTHFRWNYFFHSIEGGLFLGGMAFVAPNTVLPPMVESLGGSAWLISLMPIMMMLGFVWPPLFTAHKVEDLHFVKPVLMLSGFFQRIPYLATGFVLIYLSADHPLLALSCLALTPLVSGLFGGVTMTAWLELVAKTIPANRRSSLWAVRFVISSVIGFGAGIAITRILHVHPGAVGYGILHLIAFGFLVVSYILFALLRETNPPHDTQENRVVLAANLKSIPRMIREDKRLRDYLYTRSLMNGMFVMTPFLTIHALAVLQRPESYMGYLVSAQMVGGIVGNVLAGYLGDRFGGKIPMTMSRISLLVSSVWICFAVRPWEFSVIFALFGLAFFANQVGTTTLCIEISPPNRRATYLATMATISMPSMILASLIASWVWSGTGAFAILAAITGVSMVFSLYYLAKIDEPRGR
jgi:MFS family permease